MFSRARAACTPRRVVLAAAILLAASTAVPAAAADGGDFKDSVGAAWVRAVKANDLDAVANLYADDAVAFFPEEPAHNGKAAIRASFKQMFDTFTVVDAALTNDHHIGDATHRANWGNFSMTVRNKADGKTDVWKGRYTDVQEMRGGHWVYVADHASLEPAPAPAK
jgi:uncharacterized protein (TIGR02246 family)